MVDMQIHQESETMTSKVNKTANFLLEEAAKAKGLDLVSFLLYRVATVSVLLEEQNKTIVQLTESLNNIIDNA